MALLACEVAIKGMMMANENLVQTLQTMGLTIKSTEQPFEERKFLPGGSEFCSASSRAKRKLLI